MPTGVPGRAGAVSSRRIAGGPRPPPNGNRALFVERDQHDGVKEQADGAVDSTGHWSPQPPRLRRAQCRATTRRSRSLSPTIGAGRLGGADGRTEPADLGPPHPPGQLPEHGPGAYAPNSDFAEVLSTTRRVILVDRSRSVYEAILAQESNWDQASWHAAARINGNPLIADYYGAAGPSSDRLCRGGLRLRHRAGHYRHEGRGHLRCTRCTARRRSRSTTRRTSPRAYRSWRSSGTSSTPTASPVTRRPALPGELVLRDLGLQHRDPARRRARQHHRLHPRARRAPGPDGPGVWAGRTTPQTRTTRPPAPVPEDTYADAAHPGNWPYQERVLGWMGTPLIRYGSRPTRPRPTTAAELAANPRPSPRSARLADNDCTPPRPRTTRHLHRSPTRVLVARPGHLDPELLDHLRDQLATPSARGQANPRSPTRTPRYAARHQHCAVDGVDHRPGAGRPRRAEPGRSTSSAAGRQNWSTTAASPTPTAPTRNGDPIGADRHSPTRRRFRRGHPLHPHRERLRPET